MNLQNLLRLPGALRTFRTRAGLSQKALALSMGLDQAVLCAAEKGRRGALPKDVMSRLAISVNLTDEECRQLELLGEHDRLLRELAAGPFGDALELLSAALLAHERHGHLARQGLVRMLRRAAESGQDVMELERLADTQSQPRREANMT